MDPNLQQGYPNKQEKVTMPGDLYQKRRDDIDSGMIHQDRINTRREEDRRKNVLPQNGKE
jgi:hypothetical protein